MSEHPAKPLLNAGDPTGDPRERRQYTRHHLALAVQLIQGPRILRAVMQNISAGGARMTILPGQSLEIGDHVTCVFSPSASTRIRLDGEVRWVESSEPPGIGVEWKTLLGRDQLLTFIGHDPDDSQHG